MPQLPDIGEIEISSETDRKNSESILKALVVNMGMLKELEHENGKLKFVLMKNQQMFKEEFDKNIKVLAGSLKQKEDYAEKRQRELFNKFKSTNQALGASLNNEKQKSNLLIKKYIELFNASRKIFIEKKRLELANKKLVLGLIGSEKRNQEIKNETEHKAQEIKKGYETKVKTVVDSIKEKEELLAISHGRIIREHEEIKIDLLKRLEIEKKKTDFLKNKYQSVVLVTDKLRKDNLVLEDINKRICSKLKIIEKKSLADEAVMKSISEIKIIESERKVTNMAKQQIDKELEYKAKIESLTSDLKHYYHELNLLKLKYYSREKELKEKLKDILN